MPYKHKDYTRKSGTRSVCDPIDDNTRSSSLKDLAIEIRKKLGNLITAPCNRASNQNTI